MVRFLRTGEVARETGISFGKIKFALATGRVRPIRDGAGLYLWLPEHIEQLCRVVAEAALKPAPGRPVSEIATA